MQKTQTITKNDRDSTISIFITTIIEYDKDSTISLFMNRFILLIILYISLPDLVNMYIVLNTCNINDNMVLNTNILHIVDDLKHLFTLNMIIRIFEIVAYTGSFLLWCKYTNENVKIVYLHSFGLLLMSISIPLNTSSNIKSTTKYMDIISNLCNSDDLYKYEQICEFSKYKIKSYLDFESFIYSTSVVYFSLVFGTYLGLFTVTIILKTRVCGF